MIVKGLAEARLGELLQNNEFVKIKKHDCEHKIYIAQTNLYPLIGQLISDYPQERFSEAMILAGINILAQVSHLESAKEFKKDYDRFLSSFEVP